MAKFIINNSVLNGTISIDGAKNSALPILAASILGNGTSTLRGIPKLSDVINMYKLLDWIGMEISTTDDCTKLSCSKIYNQTTPYELVSNMRASFLITGPLLARQGYTRIALPGGCAIGSRPIDLHLKGFVAMGAEIFQQHGYIEARAKKLNGARIYLDFPSVGATENILMAATLADGITTIENASAEPEVIDLANYLSAMGADVSGAGTDTIKITGVDSLSAADHTIIPDRIEAGTYMVAAAITHGNVRIENTVTEHLRPVVAKLKEMGAQIDEDDTWIEVRGNDLKSTDVKTMPFPGFPTDMQAQFMALMGTTEGTSMMVETIFENRFMHTTELKRMGANIKIEGHSAVVEGVKRFTGAKVRATDLRAGAALVLAGLCAQGQTEIDDIEHIDRGYFEMEKKLENLGAQITREE